MYFTVETLNIGTWVYTNTFFCIAFTQQFCIYRSLRCSVFKHQHTPNALFIVALLNLSFPFLSSVHLASAPVMHGALPYEKGILVCVGLLIPSSATNSESLTSGSQPGSHLCAPKSLIWLGPYFPK